MAQQPEQKPLTLHRLGVKAYRWGLAIIAIAFILALIWSLYGDVIVNPPTLPSRRY